MKVSLIVALCLLGLIASSLATYGYPSYGGYYGYGAYGNQARVGGGVGNGGIFALIGMIFIILLLFSNNSSTTSSTSGFPSVSLVG